MSVFVHVIPWMVSLALMAIGVACCVPLVLAKRKGQPSLISALIAGVLLFIVGFVYFWGLVAASSVNGPSSEQCADKGGTYHVQTFSRDAYCSYPPKTKS